MYDSLCFSKTLISIIAKVSLGEKKDPKNTCADREVTISTFTK